ncbi:MAG: hypothetical protein K2K99_00300 [Muribaculaceae bacterium]|nr:hypothetical protein [Muribaculaceae bacterium]
MKHDAFEKWLKKNNPYDHQKGTIRSILSRVKRIESSYGNIDTIYETDKCCHLFEDFAYTSEDSKEGKPNPSKILIKGNIREGLASIRSALNQYILFLNS